MIGRFIEDTFQTRMSHRQSYKPDTSIIVVVYNIPREAPRTLLSLSASYQRHIHPNDYEVIVVDNGSSPCVDSRVFDNLAGNFRLIRIDPAPPSPAYAVNRGITEAKGEIIGVMVDGARMVTPGLVHFARHGVGLYERAVVATLGWYLGFDHQRWSLLSGYDQSSEDALLASINWPEDGYRLFEIATMDDSSDDGWMAPISESNALFLHRQTWDLLGGMDERFDSPGGGLVNLDTMNRAWELPDAKPVLLLGEGTFHQFHGGIATNAPVADFSSKIATWNEHYKSIRGRYWNFPEQNVPRTYLGVLPRPALARFVRAAVHPSPHHREAPLGPGFDRELWSPAATTRPADPTIASLVDIAQNEFRAGRHTTAAAVSRMIRQRTPDEPEPQRLLSLIAGWRPFEETREPLAEHHFALAEAHKLFGENDLAASNYQAALSHNRNLVQAHVGLAELRMPGEWYHAWLDRLYASLAPETVIEIGVGDGRSLTHVRPPTLAIGVDPQPIILHPLSAETHIFAETSDALFARRGPDPLLAGRPLSIGFIDGLHLYEQALRDFMNLERYCGPRSVILLHDTLPINEATQSRARDTQFHTGDVWKTVFCLKHFRPDLDIFTIATPWTGLTVVTGLDPASRVLADRYNDAVARFIDVPYSEIEGNADAALNIVANDWKVIEARLRARGIL